MRVNMWDTISSSKEYFIYIANTIKNYLYLSGAPRRKSGQAPYHHPEGRSVSTPHGHPRVHVRWRSERSTGSAPRK